MSNGLVSHSSLSIEIASNSNITAYIHYTNIITIYQSTLTTFPGGIPRKTNSRPYTYAPKYIHPLHQNHTSPRFSHHPLIIHSSFSLLPLNLYFLRTWRTSRHSPVDRRALVILPAVIHLADLLPSAVKDRIEGCYQHGYPEPDYGDDYPGVVELHTYHISMCLARQKRGRGRLR